ncbi:tRNA lysidine(34) synthetase TilS [Spirosoma endophyticum]|uniref:tRNA(Ile)-lysidine synthase n=1 Tax=Spirosoma endophyticum TaxID=662367 RepID=A0A1I2FJF7_9BACT|nr:tRNA lysidine(34) synthetase TilS [Spirosoma endophyticum]SFF04908.1 tRNA(Ile)-lysidine synthase [Spirosoma endophyticum]
MLERDFLGFINDRKLFKPTDCVLLAVSGGIDSIVMAELFHRLGQLFAIAHVNFGLRGPESETDALFVKNKAEAYGVPFHLTQFDTTEFAAERGISIQMAARDLRYAWFAQLVAEHHYVGVATAHHQNDVLETILFNLTRGTGLAGLHGIAASQNGIIRPLLFATRASIATYADERKLAYREDSSNANDKYARNRLRHHVVPVLVDLNPGLWQTLPRTVERLRAADVLVRLELDRSWQEIAEPIGGETFLPIEKLVALPELPFRLGEWLKPFGFTSDQAVQLVASLTQEIGQRFESPTHRIIHERLSSGATGLLLEELSAAPDYEIKLTDWPKVPLDVTGQFTVTMDRFHKPENFRPDTNPKVACLDADRLVFPLTIRPWRQGDRFRPLGLNGHKLVSDLLNDLKLSRSEREQTCVLLSGEQIAWVISRRIDHRFRVTNETKSVVTLSVIVKS